MAKNEEKVVDFENTEAAEDQIKVEVVKEKKGLIDKFKDLSTVKKVLVVGAIGAGVVGLGVLGASMLGGSATAEVTDALADVAAEAIKDEAVDAVVTSF